MYWEAAPPRILEGARGGSVISQSFTFFLVLPLNFQCSIICERLRDFYQILSHVHYPFSNRFLCPEPIKITKPQQSSYVHVCAKHNVQNSAHKSFLENFSNTDIYIFRRFQFIMTINPIGDILKTPLVEIMVAPRYMALIKKLFSHTCTNTNTLSSISQKKGAVHFGLLDI